jgi:hypothetical protein
VALLVKLGICELTIAASACAPSSLRSLLPGVQGLLFSALSVAWVSLAVIARAR